MPTRLKSLELHGYKTFAARTIFEFPGAITAIVGPNGSGKSNIADALRWVLGEQSFSLLRGKKTEDMIFAGSEQRARAGMASATVVFDNGDGWLPIDFSEVAVTRRAYRDGDNEYLLNGQRVRLRDVSELLAQSGLAERTYTIIGQGLVDAALSLKAEERRRLFEEAAGIGLHRSRREEALRRLETTQRNLDRVQDILSELQPRLRSLEKQARRAQEYEQIQADLRLTLREWYGYHWHQAQRELTGARQAVRAQESVQEKADQVRSELDSRLQSHRQRLLDLRARLNAWHRQSAEQHAHRETFSRNLAIVAERLRSLAEQREAAEVERSRLGQEIELSVILLEEIKRGILALEIELSDSRSQGEEVRRTLESRRLEREAVEKSVQAERQRAAIQAAQQAIAQAEAEMKAAEHRLRIANQSRRQAESARLEIETAIAAHRQRQSEIETARKEVLEARAASQAEIARLQARLDVLEQAERSLAGYASGAKVLLQARLKGTRGALSSVLEVPAEYEKAIAAALGEFVDAVLLEEGVDAEEALNILERESARAVLLPLDVFPPLPPLLSPIAGQDAILSKSIIGLASTLVSPPPELRRAIDLLLGQVFIVRDRAAARQVLKGQPPYVRAVTLRGEVFHAGGPIQTGGSAQSILAWPRQRRELQTQLAQAELQCAVLERQIESLSQELSDLETTGERLAHWNTRVAVAERALADARLRQREQQAGLERVRQAEAAACQRLTETDTASRRLDAERIALRQSEGEVTEQIEALRLLIEPAEIELEAAEAAQNTLQIQEGEARKALNLLEQQSMQTKTALARRQESLDNLRRRIEDDFGLVAFEYAETVSGPTPLPFEGMVEQLPRRENLSAEIEETLNRQRAQLKRMAPINPEAQAEYREVKERHQFLTDQVHDLTKAESAIRQLITELDSLMQREFKRTFEAVAEEFHQIFARLFGGGSARLVLTTPDDLTLSGIDIEARLPGRREQGLSLLSGGERSLTAAALVFALLRVSPTPFCILDEVDAMLDEANVGRFRDLLRELSQKTQFIVITHNRNTVQAADVIYGVTMGRDSASRVVSLKL